MPEIADWLQKLGLGQYTQRFVENDITFAYLISPDRPRFQRTWDFVPWPPASATARNRRTR